LISDNYSYRYDITLKYYLAAKDGLVDKAIKAITNSVSRDMLDRCLEDNKNN
jgi:hypothetical protein